MWWRAFQKGYCTVRINDKKSLSVKAHCPMLSCNQVSAFDMWWRCHLQETFYNENQEQNAPLCKAHVSCAYTRPPRMLASPCTMWMCTSWMTSVTWASDRCCWTRPSTVWTRRAARRRRQVDYRAPTTWRSPVPPYVAAMEYLCVCVCLLCSHGMEVTCTNARCCYRISVCVCVRVGCCGSTT